MIKTKDFIRLEVASSEELWKWLELNHSQNGAVWLVTFKKAEKEKYVSREEVLDGLLAYGWIDGVRRKLDDSRTMQLISPRRAQHWAKSYKERAKKLISENRMHKSGLASIEASKKSGLWHFMDDVDNLVIPQDLKASLSPHHGALEFFENINDSSKRFVLRWIKLAKTSKTREKRIEKICHLSSIGEKLPGS